MKRIILPTDFSEQAGYAMDLACQIAQRTGSELVVIHVLDHTGLFDFSAGSSAYPFIGNPIGIEMDQRFLESLYANAEERCQRFINEHKTEGVNITPKVKIGSAYQYISDEISEVKTDLVIMGSKGISGVEEVLIGSNTEKVVRHAKCPVLTVKSQVNLKDIRDIVFATSFREQELHVADEMIKLQRVFNARLHLLRVNTPTDFETNRVIMANAEAFVRKNELKNCTINIYNEKVQEDGILFFAQDINAGLIAMATHGYTGLVHLINGSIAEDVVNHARRPVWTFRIKH